MTTGEVMMGNGDARVILWTPVPIAKSISDPEAELESMIACRRDPGPESPVFVTRNVPANA
jgi:hypothetical protein